MVISVPKLRNLLDIHRQKKQGLFCPIIWLSEENINLLSSCFSPLPLSLQLLPPVQEVIPHSVHSSQLRDPKLLLVVQCSMVVGRHRVYDRYYPPTTLWCIKLFLFPKCWEYFVYLGMDELFHSNYFLVPLKHTHISCTSFPPSFQKNSSYTINPILDTRISSVRSSVRVSR